MLKPRNPPKKKLTDPQSMNPHKEPGSWTTPTESSMANQTME